MKIIKKIVKSIINFILKIKFRIKKKVIFGSKTKIDFKCKFEGYNKIYSGVKLSNTNIGYGTYIGPNSKLTQVKIGKFCSVGPNVKNIRGSHPSDIFVSTHPSFFSRQKQAGFTFTKQNLYEEFKYVDKNYSVIIGNDVWIGSDVKILDGIKVGDGSILASGAVVVDDVEPYSIVGGVSAKKIKYRFEKKYRRFLLNFKWWEKDIDWISKNYYEFRNIEVFFKRYSESKYK